MNFGERIYKLRTEKELSQGDLAEALEVSRQSISKWENGVSVPELEKLVKLSEVFGITLDELVTGKEGKAQPAPEPQVIYVEKPVERKNTKTQKWCIALCSLLCVLLLANLLAIFLYPSAGPEDSEVQESQYFEITSSEVSGMEIEWNSGNVRITTADTDKITIAGANNGQHYSAQLNGSLLKILPSTDPGKDLVITVPRDWICQELKLNGTSATMDLVGISVGTLDLSGSSSTLTYGGSLEKVNISGTSVTATLNCTSSVSNIVVGGNRSSVSLTLTKGCGFLANLSAPSCQFNSDLFGVRYENRKYTYGDQHCKILLNGNSCDVFVTQSK